MPSRKIEDCEKRLRDAWPTIKAKFEFKFEGWLIEIDSTHRTPEEQFELFKTGRHKLDSGYWEKIEGKPVVTNCDGTTKRSKHNYYPSKAFDVKIKNPQKDYTWNYALPQWAFLKDLALLTDLTHGSEFKSFDNGPKMPPGDWPHFQV